MNDENVAFMILSHEDRERVRLMAALWNALRSAEGGHETAIHMCRMHEEARAALVKENTKLRDDLDGSMRTLRNVRHESDAWATNLNREIALLRESLTSLVDATAKRPTDAAQKIAMKDARDALKATEPVPFLAATARRMVRFLSHFEAPMSDSDHPSGEHVIAPTAPAGEMVKGLSFAAYKSIQAEHATRLKRMLVSPLHYRHAVLNERPDTDDFRIGRATHTAILEPDRFALDFTVYTESKSRGEGSRKAWEAFKAGNASKTILDESDYARALSMRDAVRANPLALELLSGGDAEVTLTWQDLSTLAPCKARLDYVGPRGIAELKTTTRIDPHSFSRDVAHYAYHVQFAWYAAGHHRVTRTTVPYWTIVVEKNPPYDVVVYRVPESLLESSALLASGLLARVQECQAKGAWPGVAGDSPLELTLPEWANGDQKDPDVVLDFGDGDLLAL